MKHTKKKVKKKTMKKTMPKKKLIGKQKKLDMNKNRRLDKGDFKMLQKQKRKKM